MKFKLYSDGSCRNNGKENAVAYYAYTLLDGDDNFLITGSGECEVNTNNVAEMMGMLRGLEIWEEKFNGLGTITVYTDSAYISNAFHQHWIDNWEKNGWITAAKTPVKNKELWVRLQSFFKDRSKIDIVKVKGHSGDFWNEIVDKIAQEGSARGKSNCN